MELVVCIPYTVPVFMVSEWTKNCCFVVLGHSFERLYVKATKAAKSEFFPTSKYYSVKPEVHVAHQTLNTPIVC